MKLNLLLLSSLLTLIIFKGNCQSADSLDHKMEFNESFKKKEMRWLNKNGFNTTDYNWNNSQINLHLDKTLNKRYASNTFAAIGISFIATTLLLDGMNAIAYAIFDNVENEEEPKFSTGYYVVGAAVIGTSIVLKGNAKKELKKAKKLYRAGY